MNSNLYGANSASRKHISQMTDNQMNINTIDNQGIFKETMHHYIKNSPWWLIHHKQTPKIHTFHRPALINVTSHYPKRTNDLYWEEHQGNRLLRPFEPVTSPELVQTSLELAYAPTYLYFVIPLLTNGLIQRNFNNLKMNSWSNFTYRTFRYCMFPR